MSFLLAERARYEGVAQGREQLSLLPERAPSEGPRSTGAVKTPLRPCLAKH